jgi:hypothetical protein
MKPGTVVFTLLMFSGMLSAPAFASARRDAGSGCSPDGHQFDLEGLVNAPLFGQADESVALLAGRGGHGADLVVGAGLDGRGLDFAGYPNPLYYAQRDNNDCAADFEGGLPGITVPLLGTFDPLQGYPQVTADPGHDAFFIAAVFASDTNLGVGVIRTTAANLLNTTDCPNGTEVSPAFCWTVGSVTNIVPEGTGVSNPTVAVDQRTRGTGAGDVYNTASWGQDTDQGLQAQIILAACTNAELDCGSSVVISGADTYAVLPSVQVRPDGGITVSYANLLIKNFEYFEYEMRFVNCTPQGAPNPPSCSSPVLVANEKHPGVVTPGDELVSTDLAFPRHVDRLEADHKTVTTFYIYDQCAVATYTAREVGQTCTKTQVVLTSSTDGGNTWSPIQPVSPNTPGQQFLGNIALDESTGTVNIAYYSSQNDPLKLRTQIFLAQVPPEQTNVGVINQITSGLYDGPTGFIQFNQGDPAACCDYIGVAAAGTGKKGQSHAYIHYTGSTNGKFNGQKFPIYTNMLTKFDY